MKNQDNNTNKPNQGAEPKDHTNVKGYPLYPPAEDIYNKGHKVENINPEDLSEKINSSVPVESSKKEAETDSTGSELDIPGAELDDPQEDTGNEDEENNYYSIGGDEHNNLEENQGE